MQNLVDTTLCGTVGQHNRIWNLKRHIIAELHARGGKANLTSLMVIVRGNRSLGSVDEFTRTLAGMLNSGDLLPSFECSNNHIDAFFTLNQNEHILQLIEELSN